MADVYQGLTPDDVAYQRRYAQGLMQSGTDISPVGHWTQALARALQGGVGGYTMGQAGQAEREGRASGNALLAQALQGGNVQGSIGKMLANPWSADQGGKLAQGYIQNRMEQGSPMAQARLKSLEQQTAQSAAMHPLQLQEAQTALALKQRELETPKDRFQSVKEGETILRMPERGATGAPEVVYGPGQNGQPSIADPKKRAEIEHQLRGEISKASGNYNTVRDASANLEGIAKNDTAAGDIALIFSYMKILDPNSVVRETEFATAQNATGVPDRIRNMWNRVLEGQRLNPAQRTDFLNQARTISSKQLGQYQRTLDQYKGVADRTGVDWRNVVLDQEHLSPAGKTATGNATIGTDLNGQEPPVMTPEQAASQPPGTWFKTTDGRIMRKR